MFENITNLDDLRKAYRATAMKAHPDHGGNTEAMQAVNAAYEIRFNQLKNEQNRRADADPTGKTRRVNETPEQFRSVLEALLKIDGIIIELCGSWIWVSGDTRSHKDEIKASGCWWAKQKKMWYWRCAEDACRSSKGGKSMSHIRSKYGSERITSDGRNPDTLPA